MSCEGITIETSTLDEVIKIGIVGPQGSKGDKGDKGDPGDGGGAVVSVNGETGTVVLDAADVGAAADNDSRLSDTRDPNAHAASHAAAGSDVITPSAIGAQSIFLTETFVVSTTVTQLLSAARAKIFNIIQDASGDGSLQLPTAGALQGDIFVFRFASGGNSVTILNAESGAPIGTISSGQQRRFVRSATTSWSIVPVDTHTHGNLSDSGSIGSTSGLPIVTTTAGAVSALPLGSALQVLRVNSGGTAMEFAAAAGGGNEIADDLFRVIGSEDASKKVAFDVDGLTTATTRTLTVPDDSGAIALQSEAYDFFYATAPDDATGGSGSAWVWNIPSWSTMQVIIIIGAGGGGGSGRVGASGAVCGGGGGAGSGAFGTFITRITGGDAIEVLVGAGGAGGAAAGTAIGNGFAGTAGGDTFIKWVTPNLVFRGGSNSGRGGGGGGGGNAAVGSNGLAGLGFNITILGTSLSGINGIAGSLVGNAGGGGNNNTTQSGRAGGSIDATTTAFNGGALFGGSFTDVRESFLLPNLSPKIGTGAKGGNASITTNGIAGDNAGGLGGGGAGGGAALNGNLSGAGGNGGDAFVRINCF